MNKQTRALAIEESKTIWKYLAQHGCGKSKAIQALYHKGEILQPDYSGSCPLCEASDSCRDCPWYQTTGAACLKPNSLFSHWAWLRHYGAPKEEIKAAAQQVYDLISTFK